MKIFRVLAISCAVAGLCATESNAAGTIKQKPKPYDINTAHLFELTRSITCIPHEPETTSTSTAKSAIKDGDAALGDGHCQAAIADYQVAIDANQQNANALWHEEVVEVAQASQTGDMKIAYDLGERGYHVADLMVAAQPKNALFLFLRAETRLALLPLHVQHRSPFTVKHYAAGEYQHSYDDLTQSLALAPNYGEAYASRYIIDMRRSDQEQANYDIAQAQKFDPTAASEAMEINQRNNERIAALHAAEARASLAAAEFAMAFTMAAGGYVVEP